MFVVVSMADVCLLCVVHVVAGRRDLLDQRPAVWKPLAGGDVYV